MGPKRIEEWRCGLDACGSGVLCEDAGMCMGVAVLAAIVGGVDASCGGGLVLWDGVCIQRWW